MVRWQQRCSGADPGVPEIFQRNMTGGISGLDCLSGEGRQKIKRESSTWTAEDLTHCSREK